MNRAVSNELYDEATAYFPGGVNSPVRAFRSVSGKPLFIERGEGATIWDADGNEYLDFCGSWGPLILGHNHPAVREAVTEAIHNGMSFGAPTRQENALASLVLEHNSYVEKLRFVSSGTEAVMSSLRLARGATGRPKVLKFEGCYHGHVDAMLVKAGSGLATLGTSSSAGVPESHVQDTLVLPLNDLGAVEQAIAQYGHELACIVIEPIPANNGLLLQEESFLRGLRALCDEHGILLFFDEVISGFRVGFEGAAGYYGIRPDIVSYGKIIGGGLPVGAYGARAELMSHIAPDGPVYQAGTLSGNPVAMAAGKAQLSQCLVPGFYESLAAKTHTMVDAIQQHATSKGYPLHLHTVGSIFWMAFTENGPVRTADGIDPASMAHFSKLHHHLLERGIYLGPSGYEVGFVSAAHTPEQMQRATTAFQESLDAVFG